MEWVRGDTIGCGSFGTVILVVPENEFSNSPSMAVKCCEVINSVSLKNEKEVLDRIDSCPQIICCFADNYTVEKSAKLYNLFLEYANKGNGNLMESDVQRYAKLILKGLSFVHSKRFVQCDIKLQNILLFGNGDVKIVDFGLAKKISTAEMLLDHLFVAGDDDEITREKEESISPNCSFEEFFGSPRCLFDFPD